MRRRSLITLIAFITVSAFGWLPFAIECNKKTYASLYGCQEACQGGDKKCKSKAHKNSTHRRKAG